MPFQRGTFCGSTLRSYTSSIGWGVGQPSQITISLVDDPLNGDSFFPLPVGSPAFFSYYNFSFFGLFQKYEVKQAIDGRPTFEVVLVDPREILEGTQVIIGGYRGTVGGIPNLLNPYGYLENQQFGLSGTNEGGMPWTKISSALRDICNSGGGGSYGGGLSLNGVQYSLDLSQLPTTPAAYRLGGTSVSLMDAIAQVCEDGGCDFFVELSGFTIRVRTVSRRSQPALGTIQQIINSGISTGTVPKGSAGLEFRNEVTSSFIVGGQVNTLFPTDQIKSFWGYDADGKAIWGRVATLDLMGRTGQVITSFETELMTLNAGPIADIIGNERYQCTTFELQCARGGYDTWALYMSSNRAAISSAAKVISVFATVAFDAAAKFSQADAIDIPRELASLASDDSYSHAMRFYDFVRSYADEYMGRKYGVALPFIMNYQEDETLRIVSSYEISDAGYLEENANPLGMSSVNEDQFRNADGRFRCFVKFADVTDLDLSATPPQSSVIEGTALFTEVSVDSQILFEDKPYAIITMAGVLSDLPVDVGGDMALIAALIGADEDAYKKAAKQEYMPFAISPAVVAPSAVAIPLQSSIYTYGPWYAIGAAGKVAFEQDAGLTPWGYGDYATMNSAGQARVTNAITNMQVSESGLLEITGTPAASLGDTLQSGGPNVTNIDVNVSVTGVTTTYRFQTYTPRYGVFNKGLGERLKRLGLAGQSLRRAMRVNFRNSAAAGSTKAIVANHPAKGFHDNAPAHVKKKTPHQVLIAHNFEDVDEQGSRITRGTLQSATHVDAITLSNPSDDTEFQATAIMSMNGLYRPFSMSTSSTMSSVSEAVYAPSGIPSQASLNPFQDGHDVEVFTHGDTFTSLNGFRNEPDNTKSRMFSLRGPMMVTGWGFGWDGKKYPSADGGETFETNYLRKQETWKTGPVDVLWDDNRQVWTCHDIIRGKTVGTLPANGSGILRVPMGSGQNWELYINNYFSTGVSGDMKCIAGYSALDNGFYVIAADCASG